MKPLLSICIPTYNRSSFLRKSLHTLVEQSKNYIGKIEIIISDNASTDDTYGVIEDAKKKFSDISYFKNNENLGYDRNIDNAVKNANGEYCWFLSDDELISEGAIDYIIHILIENKDVAYFCLNVSENHIKNLPDIEIIKLQNGNELLQKYGLIGGLVSQNIIKRDLYPKYIEKYYGNLWIHMSIIFEIIVNQPLILVNKVLISGQGNHCSWANGGKAFQTFVNLKEIIASWLYLGYNGNCIDNTIRKLVRSLPMTMFSAKIHGLQKSSENLGILKKSFSSYSFYYYTARIIYETPTVLFLFLRKILGK